MTNKEAIKILKELPDRIAVMLMPLDIDFDYKEALDLAIKNLEEISQGDLISREALKKAFKIEELYWGKRIIDIINNAPTVEDRYDGGYSQGYIDGSTGAAMRGEEK